MACSQDHCITHPLFYAINLYAFYSTRINNQISYPLIEMYFAAVLYNTFPYGGDNLWKLISTYMRTGIDQDIFGSAVLHKYLQHLIGVAALVGPGVKLPVRVGSGTSFTIAIVGFGIY